MHIFGYPVDMDGFERLAARRGLWIVEDACEALGAVHADGTAVGARGNLATFGFYPNKQLATGEGGALVCPTAALKERVDSERNQGRAPDMGWLDHDRLGFNYRLSELACALGLAQLEHLDDMLAARARVAGWYAEALAGVEGLDLPCQDAGGERRSWFVYVVQLPRGVDRDATIGELRARGIDSKPYLPAIHLMSFYRERFGHREGEFPVCEDVAARSLALPFYPELTEAHDRARGSDAARGAGYRSFTSDTPPGRPLTAGLRPTSSNPRARYSARAGRLSTQVSRATEREARARGPGAPLPRAARAATPRRRKRASVASEST